MATFKINGKEHDLKLTYAAVQYLNKLEEGGSMTIVGKAMQGDSDLFPHILLAGLKHTGLDHSLEDVQQALEIAFEEQRLDFLSIMRISNEVISESFFYKPLIDKMMADNKEAKTALASLLK
ncbi:tail assembly chaperone [Paenisporosarcina sp. NPDC076898]|uniref:tail assembly chaperone n=1 Tax=unclassified Paenisporosarcina TaxID=2642018 RepID=UPI003D00BC86